MHTKEIKGLSKDGRIFDYFSPNGSFIGILSIPHSGETIPDEFRPFLIEDETTLSKDVDTAVHKLIDIPALNNAGIAVVKAHIHRVCVDLNRSPDICVLNWQKNSHGEELVRQNPDEEQKALLAQKYHAPYYEMLKALINELAKGQERPSFIDLHSMPSSPTKYHLEINPQQEKERPDFCLSDIEGKSCDKAFIDFPTNELAKSYEKVYQNNPYFGGHVTRHIDAQFPETNNIQIEIKRGIYLDEPKRLLDPAKVAKLKPVLTQALINTYKNFAQS